MTDEFANTLIERFVEIIGKVDTEKLLRERGGTEISIPKKADNSALSKIIGLEATNRLIKGFGDGKVVLPCGDYRGEAGRKKRAIEMLKEGKSPNEIALACDMHSRTVWKYKAEMLKEETNSQQMGLPFDK